MGKRNFRDDQNYCLRAFTYDPNNWLSKHWSTYSISTVVIIVANKAKYESIIQLLQLPIPDPYVGCGVTKGCIATPDGCVATKTCAMMTTYKKFDNANLVLEIYGEVIGDQYVAVGFSTDPEMVNKTLNLYWVYTWHNIWGARSLQGSDSVVECVQYRDTPKTYQSYNTPDHNNIRLTNVGIFSVLHYAFVILIKFWN